MARNARSVVNRRAEETVGLLDRVASVYADPDSYRGRVSAECRRDLALDRLRAGDRPSSARERKHRAVSLRLDDCAAVGCRELTDQRVMAAQHISPGQVAEARREDSRIDDVGEDDRDGAVHRERREEIW